jgi:hypothetical protein
MADDKKKRGGADRGLIALSEPYEVAYWSKKFKITPAKLKAAVKKAGRSAKNVEAYLKLQKHKAADRARIAVSQPYEVSYWSKKFKVTPARLKAAVAAVGHSSKAPSGGRLDRKCRRPTTPHVVEQSDAPGDGGRATPWLPQVLRHPMRDDAVGDAIAGYGEFSSPRSSRTTRRRRCS